MKVLWARRAVFSHHEFIQHSGLANGVWIRTFSSRTKTEHLKPGQTHYSLVGLQPNSSNEQMKAGFFLAKEFHFDDAITAGKSPQQAQEEFDHLQISYSVLMDPKLRSEYDRELPQVSRGQSDGMSEMWVEHEVRMERDQLSKAKKYSTKGLGIGRDQKKCSKPGGAMSR